MRSVKGSRSILAEDSKAGKEKTPVGKTTTVRMVRADGKTADVHPAEVENYRAGGYEKV